MKSLNTYLETRGKVNKQYTVAEYGTLSLTDSKCAASKSPWKLKSAHA